MNRPHPSQSAALVDHGHARVQPGSVDTAGLQDDAVTAAKIAADAVGSSEIAANAVGTSEIATNAVGADELADNAVDTNAIADNAVTNPKLADNAVGSAEIAAGAVTATKLSLPMVRCVWSANTAVSNDSSAAIAWGGSDLYDTDTMHNPVTNNTRITFGTAGVYSCGGTFTMSADADGARGISVRLNGTTDIAVDNKVTAVFGGAAGDTMAIHTEYKFAAADYIELVAFNVASGATLQVTAGGFWASYQGPG